jgi:hypothetical protein
MEDDHFVCCTFLANLLTVLTRLQEATRFSKMTLERYVMSQRQGLTQRKEHKRRVQAIDWPKQVALLKLDCGLWPDQSDAKWRLDGSEGPLRMR